MAKPNMSPTKVQMPEQEPDVRNKNFKEVALGYTKEMAMEEATRCLNCKHQPCKTGCPVGVPIPEFIKEVAAGNFEEAYKIITSENALPAICGRVCPQENQCEGKCVRGIKGEAVGIGRLERFVADYHMAHGKPATLDIKPNGKKVAIVGSGPAGITCAGELAKKGYDVTVFEALHKTGGVLSYGIPEFRLPKDLVQKEVDSVAALGVDFETNVVVGRSITIDELQEQGYQGIFIGSGAGLPRFQNIPGENLNGVYAANEFLTRVNLMKGYEFPNHPTPVKITDTVCVIGAGNVAMDAARTAKRLGAKNVYIVYRRGVDEIPARAEEVHHAKEEEIIFKLLTNPVKIEGEDGCAAMRKVTLIERMIRMRRQRRVADAFHHRMRCQILDDRCGVFCVPLEAQGKRLGSLQKQECRKGRNARSAITQQHRPDISRQRRILRGLDKGDAMIAVIGCAEKREPA